MIPPESLSCLLELVDFDLPLLPALKRPLRPCFRVPMACCGKRRREGEREREREGEGGGRQRGRERERRRESEKEIKIFTRSVYFIMHTYVFTLKNRFRNL